jgi:hypothetical protein
LLSLGPGPFQYDKFGRKSNEKAESGKLKAESGKQKAVLMTIYFLFAFDLRIKIAHM